MKLKTLMAVLIIMLAAVCAGCGKSPETEAISAYREILKAAPAIELRDEEMADASFGYDVNAETPEDHFEQFALFDIDQDGIPELIARSTVNFRWTPVSVYTFADGGAVLLKDPMDPNAHGTFEQMSTANGAYITYICAENHIHSVWRGTTPMGEQAEENSAYRLEGAVLQPVECSAGENGQTIFFDDIAEPNTEKNVSEMKPSGRSR